MSGRGDSVSDTRAYAAEAAAQQYHGGVVLNIMGCRSVQYGSFEDYLVTLTRACRRALLTPVFVYPEEPVEPRFRKEIEGAGGRLVVIPGTETPSAKGAAGLWREIRRTRPVVVHAHFGRVGYLGALLGGLSGTPAVLLSKHQTSWPYVTAKTRWTYTVLSRLVTRVLVGAGPVYDELPLLGVPWDKGVLVPFPGVDTSRYRPSRPAREQARRSLGVSAGQPLVMAVSHLKEQKGVRYLVEAMPAVIRAHPDVVLVVVGDGAVRAQLETIAASNALGDSVRFLGHRSDVPQLLTAADLFVCPSLCEGGCAGSLEAMAAGAPLVTTPVGLARDLVTEYDCGRVIAPEDSVALAGAINELLDRSSELRMMGRRARRAVQKRVAVEGVAEMLATLYVQVAASPVRRQRVGAEL